MATTKKTPAKKPAAKKPAARKSSKKPGASPGSRGLAATALTTGKPSAAATALEAAITGDGGAVLAAYQDPVGGNWQLFAALPVDRVAPTPFQRDLSAPHAARLGVVIDKLDRFLDPIVVVRSDTGAYWTPNGGHRLAAMKALGARTIVGLVLPEAEVAYQILALNTEKAHGLGEKCLEVIRMARDLAGKGDPRENVYDFAFEDPAYLTLGCCYEREPRFSGSSYTSVLGRIEEFFDLPISQALPIREARATKLLALEKAVTVAAARLKEAGYIGSGLKGFVLKVISPLESRKRTRADFDATVDKMIAAATRFDVDEVDTSELPILAD